ncbi:MAG TPA: iron-sulfur cluster assembly protein, partial [Ktedonobacteraceae bacterium]
MLFHESTSTQTMAAQHSPVTKDQVYAAIADVLDPELDESLVKLGFIEHVQVEEQDVTITFKLPTFWCAPNFAYLMAMDLHTRVRALPGVRTARVLLLDHCADDEINTGINSGQSFSEAFPDDASEDADLEHLRQAFLRKGFLMRQDNLLRQMLKAGLSSETIVALRIADMHIDEVANSVTLVTPQGTVQL